MISRHWLDNVSQRINSKKLKQEPFLHKTTGETPLGIFFSKGLRLFISVLLVFKNPTLTVDSPVGIDFNRLHQPGLSPKRISLKGNLPPASLAIIKDEILMRSVDTPCRRP